MALELHKLSMEDNERDEQYLALHGILDIFQSLTKALIVKQPEKVCRAFLLDLPRPVRWTGRVLVA